MRMVYETRKKREVGQWRRFLGTGKWIIIPGSERQKEPMAYLVREKQDLDEGKFCPFCADNLNKGLERDENPEELKGATFKDRGAPIEWIGEETFDPMFEIATNKTLEGNLNIGVIPVELTDELKKKAKIERILSVRKGEDKKWKIIGEINGEKVMYIIKKDDKKLKIYHFKLFQRVRQKMWKTCIIKNINPVLDQMTLGARFTQKDYHPYISAEGLGICDIIIESPAHFKPLGVMDREVCKNVISTYLYRFNDLQKRYSRSLDYITIFHNHRREAGSSIPHSHSQIFATPFVPIHIENEMSQAADYFQKVVPDHCPFCDMITKEKRDNKRVIQNNDRFIAITPFASGTPFEIWILPIKHNPSFGEVRSREVRDAGYNGISEDEIVDLADILTWVLGRLYICVDDPGYNFVISTPPLGFAPPNDDFWHWHIRIETQGLAIPAGYEMASQVRINPLSPEKAANFLSDNNLGNLFGLGAGSIFKRKPEDVENVLSIIRREVKEKTLNLSKEQQNILKIAAGAFMFSEYYIKRKDLYDQNKLTEEEKTILGRAISWASS